jgi:pyruvate/2-oxoglutarate dehydrogenase complex dihydrolipoamide dehydrogenase (E3) component
MVKSAKVAALARRAAEFGIRLEFDGADAIAVRDRKRAVVGEMIGRNQANFDGSGMTLLTGTARFSGPRALEVRLHEGGVRELTADKVFVNTGTRPALTPMTGLADALPLHSESVLELDRLPEHLIIRGGGYVSCEFAQMRWSTPTPMRFLASQSSLRKVGKSCRSCRLRCAPACRLPRSAT